MCWSVSNSGLFLISPLIERDKCTSVPALGFQNDVIQRCLSLIAIYLLFDVTVCQMAFRKISLSKEYLFPESWNWARAIMGLWLLNRVMTLFIGSYGKLKYKVIISEKSKILPNGYLITRVFSKDPRMKILAKFINTRTLIPLEQRHPKLIRRALVVLKYIWYHGFPQLFGNFSYLEQLFAFCAIFCSF